MPLAGPWLEHVFALHLQQVLRSDALPRSSGAPASSTTPGGGDRLRRPGRLHRAGRERARGGARSVAGRLSELAGEAPEPPVKLVKLIGDAVMLVSPEPEPMLDVTLRLVEMATRTRLPAAARRRRLRAGRAPLGRLVRHAGQPGEPAHHPCAAQHRARRRGGPRRRRRRRLRVLRRRPQEAQGLRHPCARIAREDPQSDPRRAGDGAPGGPGH